MSREGDVDIAEMCSMTSFPIADIMERLPSAVESYLKNKAGLSIEEIEKLRGILSVGKDTPKESPSGCHNRYVQFPNLIEQEAIMGLIRRYCSLYDK